MKKAMKIDTNGILIYGQDLFLEDSEPTPTGYIDVPLPINMEGQLPFYIAKWTGVEWVEDMPQEDIDLLNNVKPQSDKIDICLQEIAKLTGEKEVLAQNVYDMASIMEVVIGIMPEMEVAE